MSMTVQQLRDLLGNCDPEAEVLLAHQPSWPLQFTVKGIYAPDRFDPDDPYNEGIEPPEDERDYGNVVYIVEGSHPAHPYAPREAWDAAMSR
jgi:hypothetical protein